MFWLGLITGTSFGIVGMFALAWWLERGWSKQEWTRYSDDRDWR